MQEKDDGVCIVDPGNGHPTSVCTTEEAIKPDEQRRA